ncbi:hypothetical protein NLJ89_g6522 [Agrocybe chaxingu]|uniref:Uncharacterized protein n=1 Tax=Agrocybe chaxingu TaxID=84603 RepID=A0A9W8JYZ7_9AGAR|nr:hypothetical protein NLJ89_g6522 [Agrocybe chaxingu]
MSRVAFFLFALFASVLLALAAPVPVQDGELVELEKRLTRVGRGTWFYPGLGNCGKWNGENDLVVAIGKGLYDRNKGSNCDQWMEIVNTANGKKAYGMTRDSCQSCGDNDIDMSPALFKKISTLGTGKITVSWHFMNKSWKP